jgi:hypothetical protein
LRGKVRTFASHHLFDLPRSKIAGIRSSEPLGGARRFGSGKHP